MVEILAYSIFVSSSGEIILINNEIIAKIRTIFEIFLLTPKKKKKRELERITV